MTGKMEGFCPMATVLIVDDDHNGNEILRRLLRLHGHDAVGALTGERALDALVERRVDIVILDDMMPESNGIETLCHIRADPRTATLPVIMYTAVEDQDFHCRAIENGANDYFAKGMMEFSDLCMMVAQYAANPSIGQAAV
jgi:two-component system, OmpR family, phosphate regulon response regulator PhoB